jgi:hypothetical protein
VRDVGRGVVLGLVPGVVEVERIQETGPDLLGERRLPDCLGQHPEDEVVGVRVRPALARLEVGLADVLHGRSGVPAPVGSTQQQPVDRGVEEEVAQAAGVIEQVADLDLDRDLLEVGQVRANGCLEVDEAILGEGKDQRRGERLADARDREAGRAGDRRLRIDVGHAADAAPRRTVRKDDGCRDPRNRVPLADAVE